MSDKWDKMAEAICSSIFCKGSALQHAVKEMSEKLRRIDAVPEPAWCTKTLEAAIKAVVDLQELSLIDERKNAYNNCLYVLRGMQTVAQLKKKEATHG